MVVTTTIDEVGPSRAMQANNRLSASIACVAVQNNRLASVTQLLGAIDDLIEGNIHCSLRVAGGKLLRGTDIHHKRALVDKLFKPRGGRYFGRAKKLHAKQPESDQHHGDNYNNRVIVHRARLYTELNEPMKQKKTRPQLMTRGRLVNSLQTGQHKRRILSHFTSPIIKLVSLRRMRKTTSSPPASFNAR